MSRESEMAAIEQLITDLTWEQVEAVRTALVLMHARQISIKQSNRHLWSVHCYLHGLVPGSRDE